MITNSELLGFEHDWLACDEAGFVALFSTAGCGYAPASYRGDQELHRRAIEALIALRASTVALRYPKIVESPYRQNTWRLMAQRGIFAFDADPTSPVYERVAEPRSAVQVGNIPEVAAIAARSFRLRSILFSENRFLSSKIIRSVDEQ